MMRFNWTIGISLAIHLVLFMLAAWFFDRTPVEVPEVRGLVFDLVAPSVPPLPVDEPAPELVQEIQKKDAFSEASLPDTAVVAMPDSEVYIKTSLQDTLDSEDYYAILTGNTPELREYIVRQNLLQNSLKEDVHQKLDSIQTKRQILAANLSRFLMNPQQLKGLGGRRDAVGKRQSAKSLGSNPGMLNLAGLVAGLGRSLSDAFGNSKKKPVVGGSAGLPTLLEIDVLGKLWQKGAVADLNLYATLDTTYHITSADFYRILETMNSRGWLTRKKISPENILTIATPVGGIPVEMSPKNRRNPVYEYRPAIDKAFVMRALNLAVFNLEDSLTTVADSSHHGQDFAKREIYQKIFKLLDN